MRVVTWNMRNASIRSEAWGYLLELDPDIALLQDTGPVPEPVRERYAIASDAVTALAGRMPRHMSLILAKGKIGPFRALPVPNRWVATALTAWREYFTTRSVALATGDVINVMSVYSLAVAVPRALWENEDVTGIKLTHNRDVWATELMVATLCAHREVSTDSWIVGGDLNSSILFDDPKPRGNRELQERMESLGFSEVLRATHGHTPTWRNNRGDARYQLDHLFLTSPLAQRVVACDVGDRERIWTPRPSLSDHLPIMAELA